MNFKDIKHYELEHFQTKCLVLCGLEPILNTYLDSFVHAQIKKDSGWEIGIYIDGPEFPESKLLFRIRAAGYKYSDDGNIIERVCLIFENLKSFKKWIDEGAIMVPDDGNITSGFLDLSDMEKDVLTK